MQQMTNILFLRVTKDKLRIQKNSTKLVFLSAPGGSLTAGQEVSSQNYCNFSAVASVFQINPLIFSGQGHYGCLGTKSIRFR